MDSDPGIVAQVRSPSLQAAYELFQQDKLEQAEASLLDLEGCDLSTHFYWFLLAAIQHRSGRLKAALTHIKRAMELEPNSIQAQNAHASILFDLKRYPEAGTIYTALLQNHPDDPQLLTNLGFVLQTQGDFDAALSHYQDAIETSPKFRPALLNRAVAYTQLNQAQLALDDYQKLLEINAQDADVLANRADLYLGMGRFDKALQDVKSVEALKALSTQVQFTHCLILAALGRLADAENLYGDTLRQDPEGVQQCFARIGSQLNPSEMSFKIIWFWAAIERQKICNWQDLDALVDGLNQFAASDSNPPFVITELLFATLGLPVHPQTRRKIAERIAEQAESSVVESIVRATKTRHQNEKIHIAYLGAAFRDHPNAFLTSRLYEYHDRSQYQISVYCLNQVGQSDIEQTIRKSSDQFVELYNLPSNQIAQRLADDCVDILIDLGVYADGSRADILAYRPAPIVASYLGLELTSAAPYIDYRISDRVLMETDRENWIEKVIYLPECCFALDSQQTIDDTEISRSSAGLPEDAFVFASFNNNFKIEPVVFSLWCNILKQAPNSVLWILVNRQIVADNLIQQAEAQGVNRNRLVFCERIPRARHLGRHRLADLFLDTLWCNAHTSALESLLAGLPLLTCAGQITASRVGASVLQAAGLNELITDSLDQYQSTAINLATHPEKLCGLREQWLNQRDRCSLFDGKIQALKLEAAYQAIWQRYQAGLEPADIEIKL